MPSQSTIQDITDAIGGIDAELGGIDERRAELHRQRRALVGALEFFGGAADGATSTKSSPSWSANHIASSRLFTPTWAPSGATTLSWGARISSFTRRSAIRASFSLLRAPFDYDMPCTPKGTRQPGCNPRRGPLPAARGSGGGPCCLGALDVRGGTPAPAAGFSGRVGSNRLPLRLG